MLARRFPDLGFEQQRKVVTAAFFGKAVVEQAPHAWADIGGAQALADAGIVDFAQASERFAASAKAGTVDPFPRHEVTDAMWDLITTEAWLRAVLGTV
jgi:hypothetical protein